MSAAAAPGEPSPGSRHLAGLDVLRVVGLVGVVLSHASPWAWLPGGWGISIFFVMSGYLITGGFLRDWERDGRLDVGRFWLRRVRRIVPAYLALAAFSFAIDSTRGGGWSREYLQAVLTFGVNRFNAHHGHPGTSMAHTWSLGVEQEFYLLWPLAFVALRWVGLGAMRAGLLVVAAGSLLLRWHLVVEQGADAALVWNSFATRVDALAIGALLASCAGSAAARRLRALAAARPWLVPVAVAAVMASRAPGLPPTYVHVAGFTVTALLAALLVVLASGLDAGGIGARLRHPGLRAAGRLTYPLYLFHAWGLTIAHHVSERPLPYVAAFAAITLLLALVTERACDAVDDLVSSAVGAAGRGGAASAGGRPA